MAKSITLNSIYYFIYTTLNIFFPFATSMYVAHILTPNSIGEVALAQNIASYFSILAFLGIPTYGMREIAKWRNDKDELSKIYSELFIINLISTVFFSVLYYVVILLFPKFYTSIRLYVLTGLTVILNVLNISWLFDGLEEFGYISKRNAFFKLFMFLLLIMLVRNESDILLYAGINIIGVVGNNVINMIYSRKYVTLTLTGINLKRHIKYIGILIFVNLAIEIYTLVDTTMLGLLTANEHVTYYTYGSRVNKILLQITNTITMVLVPRASYVYKMGKYDEFNRLLTKGLQAIIILSLPMIIGLQFTSNFLFTNLYGTTYIHSAIVERILCLNLAISPIGYLLGSRVLLVSSNEKKMVFCVSAGAVINIIGNFFLIPLYREYGAAIASVLSEMIVMIMYIYQGKKIYHLEQHKDTLWKVMIASCFEFGFLLSCNWLISPSWFRLLLEVVGGAAIYLILLIIEKERFINPYYLFLSKKIKYWLDRRIDKK